MKSLQYNTSKTLKLSNILIININKDDLDNIVATVEQMENYIKSKGSQAIGPLIQYTESSVNEQGELDIVIKLLRQSSNFIQHVEPPYEMKSVIRVKNCMYVRYNGPESKLKFAYDKINLTAFEEDIELKGDSYTVFLDQDEDKLIADVFMEKANEQEPN